MKTIYIVITFLLSQSFAEAVCNMSRPEFSFWHKAKIVRISGQSFLDIRIENSSKTPITIRPIIFFNGEDKGLIKENIVLSCDEVKQFRFPFLHDKSKTIVHVIYQQNTDLSVTSRTIITQTDPMIKAKFVNTVIDEAIKGVDVDVIFEKGLEYSSFKSIIDIPLSIKRVSGFNGSFITTENLLGIKTFALTKEDNYNIKLKFGNPPKSKTTEFYITCLLNGRQVNLFRNKPIVKVSLIANESTFLEINVPKLLKGINQFKCYSLNGLVNPTTLNDDLLSPNNIPSLYIYRND